MPDTPGEAADRFANDFQRLLAAADAIGPDATIGAWTVKALIAHVAAWDREVRIALDEVLAGVRVHYAGWDQEAFNQRVTARTADAPWPDVRREAVAANAELCSKVRSIAPEDWNRWSGQMSSAGTPLTAALVMSYTYRGRTHYGGHAEELEPGPSRASRGREER